MNVLVIKSSLRPGSNSDLLADSFAEGASSAGHTVESISLKDHEIRFCRACYGCLSNHRCIMHDSAAGIISKMYKADVIAFATPVYFYGMSAQLKALLDRTVSIYGTDPAFHKIYLLTTAGETDPAIADRVATGLRGWTDCFPGTEIAETIFAGDMDEPGAVAKHPAYKQARQAGASIAAKH